MPEPQLRVDPLSGLRTLVGAGPRPDAPEPAPEAERDLFATAPARGDGVDLPHPRAVASIADLDDGELEEMAQGWREALRAQSAAACRHLYVDEDAGGSRARLVTLDFVPAAVARERERCTAYATRTMGGDLLGDLLQHEVRRRERVVALDDDAVLLAAFAPRAPYALLLVPRRPRPRFEDDGPTGAALLGDAVRRLRTAGACSAGLSLWVRTAPRGAEHFCWRVDLLPRAAPDGLELGTGLRHGVLTPEAAAARLRDAT